MGDTQPLGATGRSLLFAVRWRRGFRLLLSGDNFHPTRMTEPVTLAVVRAENGTVWMSGSGFLDGRQIDRQTGCGDCGLCLKSSHVLALLLLVVAVFSAIRECSILAMDMLH